MIYRVYTKVASPDDFWNLQKNPEKGKWWHDSECKQIPIVANFSEYITEVFQDDDPSTPEAYPALVCAEVIY